jgi:hypothetical protein
MSVKYQVNKVNDMDRRELNKLIPEGDRIKYKSDEMCLFGSTMHLCGVTYDCIKPELVNDGKPIHIGVSVLYSGTGHNDKEGLMEKEEIHKLLKRKKIDEK